MRTLARIVALLAVALSAPLANAGAPVAVIGIYTPSATFDFGSLLPGSSKTQPVGFFAPSTNTASVQITALSTSGSPEFAFTGSCVGTTLAADGICPVNAVFSPTTTGAASAQMSVTCVTVASPIVAAITFACNGTPFTLTFLGLGVIAQAVPALDPTYVATLAAALLAWGTLFLWGRRARR